MSESIFTTAHGKWDRILPALGINSGYLTGKHGPCPVCKGSDRFRYDDRAGNGEWVCSGHGMAPGKECGAGKGINLLMDFLGIDFVEAVKRVRETLGQGHLPEPIPGVVKYSEAKAKKDPTFTRDLSRKLVMSSARVREGDRVSRYLKSRGIDVLPPKGLYFNPNLECRTQNGEVTVKSYHPTMLAPVTTPDGKTIMGAHRTYLASTGDGKASIPGDDARKVLSFDFDGSAIQLFDPTPDGLLAVGEGIETMLAVHELFGWPVWSAMATHWLAALQLPPNVKTVIIMADHDPVDPKRGYRPGLHAAETLRDRLVAEGRTVKIYFPPNEGEDYNDVLKRHKGLL